MARITWQNVAAPNLSGGASALESAARMLDSGTSSLSGVGRNMRQHEKDSISAQAMARAQGITGVSAWDEMMGKHNGYEGLGIKASDLNADALEYLQGRRGDILANDQTQALTNFQNISSVGLQQRQEEALYDFDQKILFDQGEASKLARNANAEVLVNQLFDSGNLTPEALASTISGMHLSPPEQQAAFAAAAALNPALFAAPTEIADQISSMEVSENFNRVVRTQRDELALLENQNPALYYVGMAYAPGGGRKSTADAIKEAYGGGPGDLSEEFIKTGVGNHAKYLKELSERFPTVPENVRAAIVGDFKTGRWWAMDPNKDELIIDEVKVEALLTEMAKPGAISDMRALANDYLDRGAELDRFERDWGNAVNAAALHTRDARPESAQKAFDAMNSIFESINERYKQDDSIDTDTGSTSKVDDALTRVLDSGGELTYIDHGELTNIANNVAVIPQKPEDFNGGGLPFIPNEGDVNVLQSVENEYSSAENHLWDDLLSGFIEEGQLIILDGDIVPAPALSSRPVDETTGQITNSFVGKAATTEQTPNPTSGLASSLVGNAATAVTPDSAADEPEGDANDGTLNAKQVNTKKIVSQILANPGETSELTSKLLETLTLDQFYSLFSASEMGSMSDAQFNGFIDLQTAVEDAEKARKAN